MDEGPEPEGAFFWQNAPYYGFVGWFLKIATAHRREDSTIKLFLLVAVFEASQPTQQTVETAISEYCAVMGTRGTQRPGRGAAGTHLRGWATLIDPKVRQLSLIHLFCDLPVSAQRGRW